MQVVIRRDLRSAFGEARDQGSRPTCVSFAVSDAHAALRDGWEPLCCEFLFYHALQLQGGSPADGITIDAALTTVRELGQPMEEVWSYLATLPDDLSRWCPPVGPLKLFRRDGERQTSKIDHIFARLDAGQPLVLGMTLSKAFFAPDREGVINVDEPPIPAIRHAVIAIGHGTIHDQRFVLIRNSWGASWGNGGYAWVSEKYLSPRLIEIMELTKDLTHGNFC